jgi:hypothetical protein
MAAGKIDAFATNKAALLELAEAIPGAKVLPDRSGEGASRHRVPTRTCISARRPNPASHGVGFDCSRSGASPCALTYGATEAAMLESRASNW